jgi:hypothetical protein
MHPYELDLKLITLEFWFSPSMRADVKERDADRQ